MTQATFLVLTQHFKIILSLFLSPREFKDENKTDVCTFFITISVLYTHLFIEWMAEHSMTPEANLSASKFSTTKCCLAHRETGLILLVLLTIKMRPPTGATINLQKYLILHMCSPAFQSGLLPLCCKGKSYTTRPDWAFQIKALTAANNYLPFTVTWKTRWDNSCKHAPAKSVE